MTSKCPYCSTSSPVYNYRFAYGRHNGDEEHEEFCILENSCSDCGNVISVQYSPK